VDGSSRSRKALPDGVIEHATSIETTVNSDEVAEPMAGAEDKDGQGKQ
jgi:hypothetical protein